MPALSGPPAQLDFAQAMTDFKIMFPNMDTDVIEAVLRSNNGAVDTTIDQLLTMTADNEAAGGTCGSSSSSHPISNTSSVMDTPPPEYSNNLPSYQQAVRTDLPDDLLGLDLGGQPPDLLDSLGASGGGPPQPHLTAGSNDSYQSLSERRGWNPPLLGKLPSDFLRLRPPQPPHHHHHQTTAAPRHGHSYTHSSTTLHRQQLSQEMLRERMSENQRRMGDLSVGSGGGDSAMSTVGSSSSEAAQMLEDEKFAIMLQNEEFMAELRGNREFLSALEEEAGSDHFNHSQQQQQQYYTAAAKKGGGGGGGGGGSLGMDDAAFREKLKTMGKQSRQTFSRLAHLFSRGQKGGAAQRLLGHAPAPSKDNLLMSADPLMEESRDSDESDEEKHSTTKGRKYQLM